MKDLSSSFTSKAGYDEKSNTLRIEFSNGAVFDYSTITPQDAKEFMEASSPGKHFHANIKGKYPSSKVNPDEQ
jgi:hypothetical protein